MLMTYQDLSSSILIQREYLKVKNGFLMLEIEVHDEHRTVLMLVSLYEIPFMYKKLQQRYVCGPHRMAE